MNKRLLAAILLIFIFAFSVFAATAPWYEGKKLKFYDAKGLVNVESKTVYDIVHPFIGKEFSDEQYAILQKKLLKVQGIDFIKAEVSSVEDSDSVRLTIEYHELPIVNTVSYSGNSKVRTSELNMALTTLSAKSFVDPSKPTFKADAIQEIKNIYKTKGFGDDVNVSLEISDIADKSAVDLKFYIEEGIQTRIVKIAFEGNANASFYALKKPLTTKTRSLFNNGYLDNQKIEDDEKAIVKYYSTIGYIDAKVLETRIESMPESKDGFNEVTVTFVIDEGKQWRYNGMDFAGNKVFSDDVINSLINLQAPKIINMDEVNSVIEKISDLYFNNGYIGCFVVPRAERNEEDATVFYHISIEEGEQSHVEKVLVTGLTKTKEFVMLREVTLKEGQIFSKNDLITSAQNIYNTGLISTIDYDIYYGQETNGVVVEFKVVEGDQMDVQFGATFGGNVEGFPVSGFLSWSNHNLLGQAKDISLSTNLSPDSQTVSFSLGDKWVKNKRWSNTISLNFSHKKYEGDLQKATLSDQYNGWNSESTYPRGYISYNQWKASDGAYPSAKDLMDYRLFTVSLAYNTGYTYVWRPGRLTLGGGITFSYNKAVYDDKFYTPFEELTQKYHDNKFPMSNKLSFSFQWDGRDYVKNTTKGYVLSNTFTYAGGLLFGLSNWNKISTSASGYLKLASFGKAPKKHNLMFCLTTTANMMLPQFYKSDRTGSWGFYNPRESATKYEMLYIDGMTIARGHDIVYGQCFLWDNIAEISYPLVENVVNAEVFASATSIVKDYSNFKEGLNWYFSTGVGVKLKVSGFPLGLYLVKTGTKINGTSFSWTKGSIFSRENKDNSGFKFVLAISTSLI